MEPQMNNFKKTFSLKLHNLSTISSRYLHNTIINPVRAALQGNILHGQGEYEHRLSGDATPRRARAGRPQLQLATNFATSGKFDSHL